MSESDTRTVLSHIEQLSRFVVRLDHSLCLVRSSDIHKIFRRTVDTIQSNCNQSVNTLYGPLNPSSRKTLLAMCETRNTVAVKRDQSAETQSRSLVPASSEIHENPAQVPDQDQAQDPDRLKPLTSRAYTETGKAWGIPGN
jgi:hypothetical protein